MSFACINIIIKKQGWAVLSPFQNSVIFFTNLIRDYIDARASLQTVPAGGVVRTPATAREAVQLPLFTFAVTAAATFDLTEI